MYRNYGYGYYFKRIHIDLEKLIHNDLQIYDLTKSQFDILQFLIKHQKDSFCQKDLQDYFHLSNATINGLVKRLEQKAFIQRIPCSKDKRIIYIKETDKAYQLSKQISENIKKVEKKMVVGLDSNSQEDLFLLLEKVLNNLETEESPC